MKIGIGAWYENRSDSEPEGILKLGSDLRILSNEAKTPSILINPTLIKGNKQIVARVHSPTHAALPAKIA